MNDRISLSGVIDTVRIPAMWLVVVVFVAWTFLPFFRQNDQGYTVREFNEDMCKIYFDLGRFSQKRGDFKKAIESYSLALAHNPDQSVCMKNIDLCKEKLKKNFSKTVDFFSKLDSIE